MVGISAQNRLQQAKLEELFTSRHSSIKTQTMTPATERIREIQNRGYDFAFGAYIERGFNIFGKQAGLFIAFTLIFMVIVGFASLIPLVGPLAANLVLSPCLLAGYYLVAHKINAGERQIEFGDFFKGFDHLGKLVVVTIFTSLVLVASAIPFGFFIFVSAFNFGETSATFPFWAFVLLIPPIYLGISYAAAPFFAVFYNMEAWEAMEASRKVISKKWFTVFVFSIVLGLIAALGMVVLFVGLLVAIPVIALAQYEAFSDIMKLDQEESEEDEVLRHLV